MLRGKLFHCLGAAMLNARGTVSSSCPLDRKDREHVRWLRRLEI